jgi:molybdenum cofactor biosynthesis enzyme MoaA
VHSAQSGIVSSSQKRTSNRSRRVPIASLPPSPLYANASAALLEPPGAASDTAGQSSGTRLRNSCDRAITDLRISVTDRCNYCCVYCRAGDDAASYTELPIAHYLRMVRILVSLGIEMVRLTGEPLLRSGLVQMVAELAQMRRGGTDEELASYIRRVVMRKEARHHIGEPGFEKPSRNMVHIGG